YVETDIGQRRAGMFVPIFTGQNPIDPVGAAGRVAREFSAKKPELDSRCLGSFAAGDISVAVVQFANQFADEISEIVAMINKWNKRGVFISLGLPIDSVHRGSVEEVAHLPPCLEVDLGPLSMS